MKNAIPQKGFYKEFAHQKIMLYLVDLRDRILKHIYFPLQCPYFPFGKPENGAAKIVPPKMKQKIVISGCRGPWSTYR